MNEIVAPKSWIEATVKAEARRLIGLRLRAARIALGYDQPRGRTQEAFYAEVAASKQSGSNWEVGGVIPRADTLVKLYERYEINPDWILLGRPGGLPGPLAGAIIGKFNQIKGNSDR